MNRRFLFVMNPKAGTGGKKSIASGIKHWLEKNHISGELVYTQYAGHAIEIASQAKENTIVVAVGGDGTINEVCRGLLQSHQILGIIPCGSGNGLARHLKIPLELEYSLQNLLHGNIGSLDVMQINGHISVNISGIGFDAAVAEAFAKSEGRGFKNYIKLIFKLYFSFPEFNYFHLNKTNRAWMISICNSSQFGNNSMISPASKSDDGTLELAVLRKPKRIDIPILAYKLMIGKITSSKYYTCKSSNHFELNLQEAQPFHVDGEYIGREQHILVHLIQQIQVIASS